jgi:hypothetical protein
MDRRHFLQSATLVAAGAAGGAGVAAPASGEVRLAQAGAAAIPAAAAVHHGPQTRRWTEQRWLLDNIIQANGIDWDQPRSIYWNFFNKKKRECFTNYAKLSDHRVEPVWIPLDGKALPAWFHLPPGYNGGRIPVVVFVPAWTASRKPASGFTATLISTAASRCWPWRGRANTRRSSTSSARR